MNLKNFLIELIFLPNNSKFYAILFENCRSYGILFVREHLDRQRKEKYAMIPIPENSVLINLSDTDLVPEPIEQDIRDFNVFDADGEKIGYVSDLMIDNHAKKVRFLSVAYGGFLGIGERKLLIPVDSIERVDPKLHEVHIAHDEKFIGDSPHYDPHLVPYHPQIEELYSYYGIIPYWGSGYIDPALPFADHEESKHKSAQDENPKQS